MVTKRENLQKAVIFSFIIVISNIVVLYLGTAFEQFSLIWSIGAIGAITFFGTLMLTNLLSRTQFLNKGEMRKAIATSIIVVYFVLVAISTCKNCDTNVVITDTMIGHFTYIVGIVIAFYFGSRAVEAIRGTSNETVALDETEETK